MSNRPTHRIFAVIRKDPRNRDDKGFWTTIGAAWAHEDGKGFSLKLDMMPLADADIVIRERKETADESPHDAPAAQEAA